MPVFRSPRAVAASGAVRGSRLLITRFGLSTRSLLNLRARVGTGESGSPPGSMALEQARAKAVPLQARRSWG